MTNAEHILAWIENDKARYDKLLSLRAPARRCSSSNARIVNLAACLIVEDAVRVACACGDMFDEDVTERSVYEAIGLVIEWKLEN